MDRHYAWGSNVSVVSGQMLGGEMAWRSAFLLLALIGVAVPSAVEAQSRRLGPSEVDTTPVSADDVLPPDFRGTVTYRGTYQGQARTPWRSANRPGETIELTGDYIITITFDRDKVRGTLRTTGKLTGDPFTGTRDGTMCRLVDAKGYESTVYCGRSNYREKIDLTNGEDQRIRYSVQGRATEIVDFAEREQRQENIQRQRAEAEQRERARIASLPPAPAAAATKLERAVGTDSGSWIFNRYDAGSMRDVRVSSGTAVNGTLRGEYTYNGGSSGTVEAQIQGGEITCLNYWDVGSCMPLRSARSASEVAPRSRGNQADPWKCIERVTTNYSTTRTDPNSMLGPQTSYSESQSLKNHCDYAVDIYTSDDPKDQGCHLNFANILAAAWNRNPMPLSSGATIMYSPCQGKIVRVQRR